MRHISIDLETFSSAPDASIASIGAAARNDAGIVQLFYRTVDDPEGSFSPSTLRWHAKQEDPVASMGADWSPMSLGQALTDLSAWLFRFGADKEGSAALWSHATFDIPVLASAYQREGISVPWHYRNCRDLRTLYDLAGERPKLDKVGTAHRAVDDAEYQLYEVEACLRIGGFDPQGY